MKKILLGTTALAGAAFVASAASAMPIQSKTEAGIPILSASIVAQWEAGIADNDNIDSVTNGDQSQTGATRDGGFVNGHFAEVFFNGELTADNGLVYGAKVHIKTGNDAAGASQDIGTESFPGREYIYLSGGWGSLEFGNWIGADSGLNLCLVCNTYAGNGGLDTPFRHYVVEPGLGLSMAAASLLNGGGGAVGGGPGFADRGVNGYWFDQGTKATYYTPVFWGFQAGVSYTPEEDPGDGGGYFHNPFRAENTNFKDVVGIGGKWKGDFGPVGVAVSAVGGWSDGDLITSISTTSGIPSGFPVLAGGSTDNRVWDRTGLGYYEIGGKLTWAGFWFGGSWWDDGSSGALKNRDYGFNSDGWTLDAGWEGGPWAIELQYATSERSGASGAINPGDAFSHINLGAGGTIVPTILDGVLAPFGPATINNETDFDGYNVSVGFYETSIDPRIIALYETVAGAGTFPSLDNEAAVFVTGMYVSF